MNEVVTTSIAKEEGDVETQLGEILSHYRTNVSLFTVKDEEIIREVISIANRIINESG